MLGLRVGWRILFTILLHFLTGILSIDYFVWATKNSDLAINFEEYFTSTSKIRFLLQIHYTSYVIYRQKLKLTTN